MPFNLDEKYIINTENKLGVTLPKSYREKMMMDNGGTVTFNTTGCEDEEQVFFLYPIYDETDKKRIKRTCNDIVRETLKGREQYSVPSNLILIGDDGGSAWLTLYILEDGVVDNAVYAYPMDFEPMYKLVSDFSAFSILDK